MHDAYFRLRRTSILGLVCGSILAAVFVREECRPLNAPPEVGVLTLHPSR